MFVLTKVSIYVITPRTICIMTYYFWGSNQLHIFAFIHDDTCNEDAIYEQSLVDRSQSLFYFLHQEKSHSHAGSARCIYKTLKARHVYPVITIQFDKTTASEITQFDLIKCFLYADEGHLQLLVC